MFYDNLASACNENGVKIATVVKECGGSVGSIDGWKKGAIPRSDIVVKLSSRLNVTTDFLLLGKNSTVLGLSHGEQQILSYFNALNDEGKEKALERLEEMAAFDRYKKGDQSGMAKDA